MSTSSSFVNPKLKNYDTKFQLVRYFSSPFYEFNNFQLFMCDIFQYRCVETWWLQNTV